MPIAKGSKKTDAQRKAENKYSKANFKTAACKIQIEKYNRFQAYAKGQGKTVSGLLSEYINNCIGADPGQPENRQAGKENGSD